jgi:hypothetical protein
MVTSFSAWAAVGVVALSASLQQPPPAQPGPPPAPRPEPRLKAGDTAPAFSLPGSDGKTHRLADYKGKTVVLAWFPKAFTGG